MTKMGDGRMYLVPQEYELDFDPKTASIYFGNLFNGNKVLGESSSKTHSEHDLELPAVHRHSVRTWWVVKAPGERALPLGLPGW
jgi:hypothetical protein